MKSGIYRTLVLIPLLTTLLTPPVRAAAKDSTTVSQELDLSLGSVAGSTTLLDHLHARPMSELNSDVKYVASPLINKDLLLRVGGEWQRFSFPNRRPPQAPDLLQQTSAIFGFDYQLGEQWLMRSEVQPGLYGDFSEISWRSFDAPVIFGLVYLVDADLQWFFGLRVDARSQYPVFPAFGVRWKYSDLWTLDLQLPNPRVEYDVNNTFQAYLGAGILAGTYSVGDHFGDDHGVPKLNHATLDYTEVRLGPGFTWKAHPNMTVEIEGGYVLKRTWDFFDQGISMDSSPRPYLQFTSHFRF
jgi:hypothetical protein